MQSLDLTPKQIKELQEAGRVTVEIKVRTNDNTITSIVYVKNESTIPYGKYTGWVKKCGAPYLIPVKPPFKVGDVYALVVDCKGLEIADAVKIADFVTSNLVQCLTSDIKEKDGKWYWVGEFISKYVEEI